MIRSLLLALSLALPLSATAIPLDLNDFFVLSPGFVSVAADGSSAVISEDPNSASNGLSNDPFLGDPEIIVAAPDTRLLLDYDFDEGALPNDDLFTAYLFDSDTGFALGAPFEFVADSSAAGTIAWDLSSLVGTTLGMDILLNSFDTVTGSQVTVSNLRLEPIQSIGAPGVLLLTLTGLGLAGARRRRPGA